MSKDKQPSITCPQCHRTSYHPQDIQRAYCGWCHQWHDTMESKMTHVPTAYVDKYDSRFWIFLPTPSGAICRLYTSYPYKGDAEMAAQFLGFKLIPKPAPERPVVTLNRNTTTPR